MSRHHTRTDTGPKHRREGEGLKATIFGLAISSPAAALTSAIVGNLMWLAASMVLTSGAWLAIAALAYAGKLDLIQELSTKYDVPPTPDFWRHGGMRNAPATPPTNRG